MTGSLEGKIALVTGSARGLGRSHALLLAERGAEVVVHDVRAELAEETAGEIRRKGGVARVLISDVRDVGAFQSDIVGLGPIDILVNNAGIGGQRKRIEDISEADVDDMFAVHYKGTFFAAQAVIPQMKARCAGKIVNTSSIYAMGGNENASHYASMKSAISGLTKCWARELAPWRINVNAVAPGFVRTDTTEAGRTEEQLRAREEKMPLGRLCRPIDISHAVAWLASAETDMITGQIVSPNAGEYIVGY